MYTIGWDKKTKKSYYWEAAGDVPVCVQVWGIDASHPKGGWFGGGCNYSGYTTVPWGNTAGYGKLRAHSISFLGSFVPWDG